MSLILRTGLGVGPNRSGLTPRASKEGQPASRWGRSWEQCRQGSGSHNLHLFEGSSRSVQPQVPKPLQCASPPRLIIFKGHRSVCTLSSLLGLFMSVHIFSMPVIQTVSRVHKSFDGWSSVHSFQLPSAHEISDPGSALRVLAGLVEGGRKRFIPSECQGCCISARQPSAAAAAAAAATTAAAAAVEVVAGGGQLDEGSIAARAAPRGRGPAVGGAAPNHLHPQGPHYGRPIPSPVGSLLSLLRP
jgi:hypothetical protein